MKMKKSTIGILAIAALILNACKNDEANNVVVNPNDYNVSDSGNIVTVKNLPADTIIGINDTTGPYSAGKYTFFSLGTNSKIASTDSATSNWDLAFSGTTIRINGGTSGPGNGGAFVYTGTFDALTTIPVDSNFKIDAYPTYAITKGSGKGWYTYDGPNNLIKAIPGRVLVIRSAAGKYAKVEVLNYYKGNTTPLSTASDSIKTYNARYYSFRYTYQPDGTTTF
jgi:hypothetical protein